MNCISIYINLFKNNNILYTIVSIYLVLDVCYTMNFHYNIWNILRPARTSSTSGCSSTSAD